MAHKTGQDLIDEFWPGALTLVCQATPTLHWDLGDTRGTVAVRMPLHQVALELLHRRRRFRQEIRDALADLAARSVANVLGAFDDCLSRAVEDYVE